MAMQWRVVSQRQTEELTPGGTFESTITVNFALASGTTGSVKIPARLYSADYARGVINEAASAMLAVEGLEG